MLNSGQTRKHLHKIKLFYFTANTDLVKQMMIMYDIQERVFRASVNDLYNKVLGCRFVKQHCCAIRVVPLWISIQSGDCEIDSCILMRKTVKIPES